MIRNGTVVHMVLAAGGVEGQSGGGGWGFTIGLHFLFPWLQPNAWMLHSLVMLEILKYQVYIYCTCG